MSICAFNVQLKGGKVQGTICGLLFIILSILVYTVEISGSVISFAMGLLACVAVILMVADLEGKFGRVMDFLAKYTMPIFLMHCYHQTVKEYKSNGSLIRSKTDYYQAIGG